MNHKSLTLLLILALLLTVTPCYAQSSQQAFSISNKSSQLDLLAKIIHAEARGETFTGKIAVGAVVINRLKSDKFPNRIARVIYQPAAFTAVSDGQINLSPDYESYQAAFIALQGADPTEGALFYYNPDISTSDWIYNRPIIKRIGNHIFAY
ncbi:hypothetical protein JCM16358_04800 [Halanaerocella petrolearia]